MIFNIIPWYEYFEFLSLLLSLTYYKELKKFKIFAFIPLLAVVCVIEIIAANMVVHHMPTYSLYNVYLVITTPFYFIVFLSILQYRGLLNYLLLFVFFLTLMLMFINLLYLQGIERFNTYSLIMVEFLKAVLSLLTLLKLFEQVDIEGRIFNHPYFWIGGGTLVFGLCSLVILGLQELIEFKKVQIDGKNIYRVLQPVIIVFLYSSYSYAFYLCKKIVGKSQQ